MEHKERKRSMVLDRIMKTITFEEMEEACNRISLAIKIYDEMAAKGIWHEELAEKIGVTKDTVSDWVSGSVDIPEDAIKKIDNILGTELFDKFHSNKN